jgi:NAD(P)-dependent dehydrogenase (short-subunit alcohol dehydrogenase family)
MSPYPFILISPATRGLSLALVRYALRTTDLPIYATHRHGEAETVRRDMLSSLSVDQSRLKLLKLDLSEEQSIADAAEKLSGFLPSDSDPYIHTAFLTGAILHPERQPADLDVVKIQETFQINTISHLLMIKHFSRFLPSSRTELPKDHLSKWVHVSARIGSISDNKRGGWYSHRSSKAALNQIIKTFDLDLQHRSTPSICLGVHPGTMKTEFSREFWDSVDDDKLFTPEYAAEHVTKVVEKLSVNDRGRIWDWKGDEIQP